jgi:glucose-1-phosphate adenylyltransferase
MPADIYTYILAGGVGSRLSILSTHRAKPAVPFGGKYRIIDFTLSNAVNSGLYDIGVLTQYRPYSLNRHIGIGRPWDLDRKTGGVRLLQPYLGWRDTDWYRGTADAVLQNLDQVIERGSKLVFIVSGDHIYRMDYRKMLAFHAEAEAEVTLAVKPVPIVEASQFGIMSLDEEGRVVAFHEKPSDPPGNLASMGVYVFNADFLIAALGEMAEYGGSDFGRDVIPRLIRSRRIFGYRFDGYWQDVGTLDAYYDANIALTREDPPFQLDDPSWNIYTVSHNEPAAKFDSGADVRSSIVASGSIIEGAVSNSVIFPGVHVRAGARVESSIVLDGCDIGADTSVNRAILDKNVRTGRGSMIGSGDSARPNETDPQHLFSGLNVVGRRSRLPDGIVIERNCLLFPDLLPEHFRETRVPAGTSVLPGSGSSGVRIR